MKTVLFVITIIGTFLWVIDINSNQTMPQPYKFWDNYGIHVGSKYRRTEIDPNPFRKATCDTITIIGIKNDFVKYSIKNDTDTFRFGSIGAGFYQLTEL